MRLAVALFVAFVAPITAFAPSTSCRGVIAASRTRATNALRAKDSNEKPLGIAAAPETADTRDDDDPDPRRAISAAPTFEEFLKFKQAERGETELKIP